MSILSEFDEALVLSEMQNDSTGRGYKVESTGRTYPAYMDIDSWNAFKSAMIEEHRNQFALGSGKELEEKDGRPPKMASYASSSRMIYKLSRRKKKFIFEKQLPTTVGGKANLDGYFVESQRYVYIEAKCREPYGYKAEQAIKRNYRKVYEYLCQQMPEIFACSMKDIPEMPGAKRPKNEMNVVFSCKGQVVSGFDIKQMICHLLAVATDRLVRPDEMGVLFLYLLYNPSELKLGVDARQEILSIYRETCWAAENYDFKTMFGHIVDYVAGVKKHSATDLDIQHIKSSFEFVLCDQTDYLRFVSMD